MLGEFGLDKPCDNIIFRIHPLHLIYIEREDLLTLVLPFYPIGVWAIIIVLEVLASDLNLNFHCPNCLVISNWIGQMYAIDAKRSTFFILFFQNYLPPS
jgi:hypothetical protein